MKCFKCKEFPVLYATGKYAQLCKKCRRKQLYQDNIDKEKNGCKSWYSRHKQSEIEKNAQYRKENRELFDWYHNKDRFGGFRNYILSRDKECLICKTKEKLIVHHIDGKGYKNGTPNNDTNNLITLCSSCHHKLHWWQRKNRLLKSIEDIARTMAKVIEANGKS